MMYYAGSTRSTPRSSASSKFPYVNVLSRSTLWKCHETAPSVIECCYKDFCVYDLSDLGSHFGLEEQMGNHRDSATYCKAMIQTIRGQDDVDIIIHVESALPGLESSAISELACSTCQKPDISLKAKQEKYAQMFAPARMKIQSGNASTDLLRMRTMFNPNMKKIIGFCFPQLPKKQGVQGKKLCVIEVEVCWRGFEFVYKLTPLKTVQEVGPKLCEALCFLHGLEPFNERHKQEKPMVLQLAKDDLVWYFGKGAYQMEFISALLQYKIPLWEQQRTKMDFLASISILRSGPMCNVVNLVETEVCNLCCYTYKLLPHNPLGHKEAKQCVRHLCVQMCRAINELHRVPKLAHLDIRLDNVLIL